jgi:hypothetical protein
MDAVDNVCERRMQLERAFSTIVRASLSMLSGPLSFWLSDRTRLNGCAVDQWIANTYATN